MAEPKTVADLVKHMQAAVDIPVTVKHRIGIDDFDSYEFMVDFVQTVAAAGCTRFIVHARTAWLQGLSPKQNREIPPLRYEDVYRLKQDFPELDIEINGGIDTIEDIKMHLQHIDGVMIGRAFYHNPYLLAEANSLWNEAAPETIRQRQSTTHDDTALSRIVSRIDGCTQMAASIERQTSAHAR